jgi:hypothetical protein
MNDPPGNPNPLDYDWSGTSKTLHAIMAERRQWWGSLSNIQKELRNNAQYFGHMEDVWDVTEYRLDENNFSLIQRTQQQGTLYNTCYKHIENEIENEIRDPDGSSNSSSQQGNTCKLDPIGNPNAQRAHLLSHAPVCHRAYPFLAEAAIGIDVASLGLSGNLPTNRRKLLVGVKGGHRFTSLKGHKFNQMYWKGQGENFDTEAPSVLVVPLLPMDQILNWAMDEQYAVSYDVAVFTFGEKKELVAQETLRYAKGICSNMEIALARENLATFVKGIASHLITKNVFESLPEKYFVAKNRSLHKWRETVRQLRANPRILIPTARDGADPHIRIAKARMTTGTSLPDPWLLLAKSAINYTASNGQKIMPACPPDDSDSDDEDDENYNHLDPKCDDDKMDPIRASFCQDALKRGGLVI